jgi:hypothetical protein
MKQIPLLEIKDLPSPSHWEGRGLVNLCYDRYVSIKFIKMKPFVKIFKTCAFWGKRTFKDKVIF